LRSAFAINAERLMPGNHLQLRFEDLSSDPNATLARALEFLERKGNGDGLVSRTTPAHDSAVREGPQVAATHAPINPEQTASRHPIEPAPDRRPPLPAVSTVSAPGTSIAQGEEAWRRGDFQTAIQALGAVAKSTDSILPKLADALFKKGHYGEALIRFRQALTSDEINAELWLGLGQTRLALGQRTEAAADLHRALDLGLTQPVGALRLIASLGHEMLPPARAALERNPHDIALLALTAEIELIYGNIAEALSKAQRLCELVPDRVDLIIPLVEELTKRKWLTEAQTLLEPLVRAMPDDPEVERLAGLLEAKAKEVQKQTAVATQSSEGTTPPSPTTELWRRAFHRGKHMLKMFLRA
jgi:tetratricopeptide (TPR) repeat protein